MKQKMKKKRENVDWKYRLEKEILFSSRTLLLALSFKPVFLKAVKTFL